MSIFNWVGNQAGGGSGQANTASNVGAGPGQVFKEKIGVDLRFRSFKSSDGSLTPSTDTDEVNHIIAPGGVTDPKVAAGINANKIGDGSVSNDLYNFLPSIPTTGHITGGVISINGGDNTKFDLTAGEGFVVDTSTPTNPVITKVTWNTSLAVTVTNIATQPFTTIAIDNTGSIVQLGLVADIPADRRQYILLGVVFHANLTNINGVSNQGFQTYDTGASLLDLAIAIGPLNLSGNVISGNSTNTLRLDRSAGVSYATGFSSKTDTTAPNQFTEGAVAGPDFIYSYRDGSGGYTQVLTSPGDITPALYDDGSGTPAAVATNKWTIQRVYLFGPGVMAVELGQNIYNSQSGAQAVAQSEVHDANPDLLVGGSLRSWLIVRGGATDLTDPSDASFLQVGKFGSSAGGGSSSTTDLQTAYDNSIDPEIILSTAPGGLSILDNATPLGTTLFHVENNARTQDYFGVDANKTFANNPFEIHEGKDLRLYDVGNSNYQGFKSPALTANQIWTLPDGDGLANETMLTNASGLLSWGGHDDLAGYVANEHIDWTSTSEDLDTSGTIKAGTGSAAAPSILVDTDSGMYRFAADRLGFSAGGVASFLVDADGNSSISGTASKPGYNFALGGTTGMGMYRIASNILGLATNGVEQARIDSSGNVGIGDTSPDCKLHVTGGSALTGKFETSNDILQIHLFPDNGTGNTWSHFAYDSADQYDIVSGTSASSGDVARLDGSNMASGWSFPSDERHKTDWKPFKNALQMLRDLKTGTYLRKDDKKKIRKSGLSAQEVLEILPEGVNTNDPDNLRVYHSALIPVMIKAIQELEDVIFENHNQLAG